MEKPSPRGRNAIVWRAEIGGFPALLRARVKIYSANMRLVFRPSKPHPSSSGLYTIGATMHDRCIEKKPLARSRGDRDRSLVSPMAFIFRYGKREWREKPKSKERSLDSSFRLIGRSGYARVTSSSRVCAVEKRLGESKAIGLN